MTIPKDLSTVLDAAYESMERNSEHRLGLGFRQRIWSALGPPQDRTHAARSVGLERRVALALSCAELVGPIWRAVETANGNALMIRLAEQYLQGEIDGYSAWQGMNGFLASLEASTAPQGSVIFAAYAATGALCVALYDENFDPLEFDDSGSDRQQEFLDWDAALSASVAYSRERDASEGETLQLRRQFWTWYLKEAVPACLPGLVRLSRPQDTVT